MNRNAGLQTFVARNYKRFQLAAAPPKPKLRKRVRPFKRKNSVLAAIEGCYGFWTTLAERMGVTTYTMQRVLHQPGWESVLEAFQEEKLKLGEVCGKNIISLALNSTSHEVQFKASAYLAERRIPDFHPVSKVVVEGGANPIQHQHQHQHQHVVFQADIMDCGVEERMKALEVGEVKEMELNGNRTQG